MSLSTAGATELGSNFLEMRDPNAAMGPAAAKKRIARLISNATCGLLFIAAQGGVWRRAVERKLCMLTSCRCPTSRSLERQKATCLLYVSRPRTNIGFFRPVSLIQVADAGSRDGVNGTYIGQTGVPDARKLLDWRGVARSRVGTADHSVDGWPTSGQFIGAYCTILGARSYAYRCGYIQYGRPEADACVVL